MITKLALANNQFYSILIEIRNEFFDLANNQFYSILIEIRNEFFDLIG